jgi:hypothetical protein
MSVVWVTLCLAVTTPTGMEPVLVVVVVSLVSLTMLEMLKLDVSFRLHL